MFDYMETVAMLPDLDPIQEHLLEVLKSYVPLDGIAYLAMENWGSKSFVPFLTYPSDTECVVPYWARCSRSMLKKGVHYDCGCCQNCIVPYEGTIHRTLSHRTPLCCLLSFARQEMFLCQPSIENTIQQKVIHIGNVESMEARLILVLSGPEHLNSSSIKSAFQINLTDVEKRSLLRFSLEWIRAVTSYYLDENTISIEKLLTQAAAIFSDETSCPPLFPILHFELKHQESKKSIYKINPLAWNCHMHSGPEWSKHIPQMSNRLKDLWCEELREAEKVPIWIEDLETFGKLYGIADESFIRKVESVFDVIHPLCTFQRKIVDINGDGRLRSDEWMFFVRYNVLKTHFNNKHYDFKGEYWCESGETKNFPSYDELARVLDCIFAQVHNCTDVPYSIATIWAVSISDIENTRYELVTFITGKDEYTKAYVQKLLSDQEDNTIKSLKIGSKGSLRYQAGNIWASNHDIPENKISDSSIRYTEYLLKYIDSRINQEIWTGVNEIDTALNIFRKPYDDAKWPECWYHNNIEEEWDEKLKSVFENWIRSNTSSNNGEIAAASINVAKVLMMLPEVNVIEKWGEKVKGSSTKAKERERSAGHWYHTCNSITDSDRTIDDKQFTEILEALNIKKLSVQKGSYQLPIIPGLPFLLSISQFLNYLSAPIEHNDGIGYTDFEVFRIEDTENQALSYGIRIHLKNVRYKDDKEEEIGDWALATYFLEKLSLFTSKEGSPADGLRFLLVCQINFRDAVSHDWQRYFVGPSNGHALLSLPINISFKESTIILKWEKRGL
ncbi:hypothetical protein ACFL47_02640 [Candidatus Latescibacterota bacterium]